MRRFSSLCVSVFSVSLWLVPSSSAADPLLGTKPLAEKGDLARLMVDGIPKYLDREMAASVEGRRDRQSSVKNAEKGRGPEEQRPYVENQPNASSGGF